MHANAISCANGCMPPRGVVLVGPSKVWLEFWRARRGARHLALGSCRAGGLETLGFWVECFTGVIELPWC